MLRRHADAVSALLWLLVLAPAGSSAAGISREPARIARARSDMTVVLAPAVRQSIRRHFPGYDLPRLRDFDPGLRRDMLAPDLPRGEPAESFACVGDFDGNGLPDGVLFLKNQRNRWLLVAFHQTYHGVFRPYRLRRWQPGPDGRFACWILCHPPGSVHPYFHSAEEFSEKRAVWSKHAWIEMEDDGDTEDFGYYFGRGKYQSVQLG